MVRKFRTIVGDYPVHQIKRLVLNFPGFETTSAKHQLERLSAGGQKTAQLWAFDLERSEIPDDGNALSTSVDFTSKSKNWQTETRYVHFSWADIIDKYENMSYPKSLFVNFPKYMRFFLDGTVFRYFKHSTRYGSFTVYPILLMIIFGLVAWGIVSLIGTPAWAFIILGIIIFFALCKFPGDRFYVNLSINDWGFAKDMCNRSNPEIEERYAQFAKIVEQEISAQNYDEILIVGHSFGSVWAVAALSHVLETNSKLLDGKRVTFFALGSSFLKMALVKSANHFTGFAKNVLAVKNLVWHEVQTKTDFISFYKSEPFKPLGIDETESDIITHRVNFKNALSKERHRKMVKSMYLAHRQYILYCDKRVHHDFQLRCFGPFFADELARQPDMIDINPLIPAVGIENDT